MHTAGDMADTHSKEKQLRQVSRQHSSGPMANCIAMVIRFDSPVMLAYESIFSKSFLNSEFEKLEVKTNF